MADPIVSLRFDALRNAIYHSSRRHFFDFWNRSLSFLVVAGGALAFADLGRRFHISQEMFAAVATTAGLLQLVFDFGSKARTHEFLQRRLYEMIAEMSETKEPTAEQLARWEATLNRVYAEEPPPMRALDAVAYNAAVDSLGRGAEHRIPIRWWQSLFRQFWPFNETAF
jgi:hypothetical protein